jgi:Na+-transporting NADH:ubiquinone oxidoreductase subunit NqrC
MSTRKRLDLGAEVDNPKWKALWDGKKIYKDGVKSKIAVHQGQGRPFKSNKMADPTK